jgi:reverse gyrase
MITIEKINEVYIRIYTDPSIAQELSEFFTFEVPGARFTPAFKARIWDGKIRMYDLHRKTLYLGLLKYVQDFAERNDYDIVYQNEVTSTTNVSIENIKEYAEWLNLHGRGEPIKIRNYQLDAIHKAVSSERTVLLSPTASGKSLIIYTTMRYHLEEGRKVILVVPTTSLVEQMYTDFQDYSSANGWRVDRHCQKLYSGFTRDFPKSRIALHLENGTKVTLAGSENIRMINKSMKHVSELTEGDDIDEQWLRENIHRLQAYK